MIEIPGVGPLLATAIVATVADAHGDWTVSCNLTTQNGTAARACMLSQERTDAQSRHRVPLSSVPITRSSRERSCCRSAWRLTRA
ncbi:hypothetical protein EN856_32400 [Mesorhizobium sp. M8A.F.Ca.ET.213.01.1.1]|uniref:hypothetical protein n=1 Tax=Mesorhizobium sp. M8A.F.Ca.ET.213.01.1.1 TaxID=2563970 RepID=UPI00113A4244|nr:hypothetical protein [Mesorhizobium sp. M8A.F.Ca.ET.213.01.1.1]TGP85998.1 hypothetical protein EN861_32860 [Mesorhizobium sp. M8A.F.Ca.ET.218.01.1.1]TGT14908.1 hypothetical protein EN856_32400 [Mesorhizobium sp. M8A.F.Ca.ET.213.01.1.1]